MVGKQNEETAQLLAIIKAQDEELAELRVELRKARLDPLTGLAKRDELISAISHALNNGHMPVSVLFLDLNGFREVNNLYGHAVGDSLLIQFAEFLRNFKNSEGKDGALITLARLGGDEFVIVLPYTTETAAAKIAAKIKETLLDATFTTGDLQFEVHAAIGAATTGHGCLAVPELLHSADVKMYEDKAAGTKEGRITKILP